MPTSPALGVELLFSFEASLEAVRDRPVEWQWIGSTCGSALLRLVGDLGWALVQTVDGSGELAIEHLQAPQFPFSKSRSEEEG